MKKMSYGADLRLLGFQAAKLAIGVKPIQPADLYATINRLLQDTSAGDMSTGVLPTPGS